MICPIIISGLYASPKYPEKSDVKYLISCYEEECAWWDKNYNQCAVLSIAKKKIEYLDEEPV